MKLDEKLKAIELRKNGYGYPSIAKILDVSKSTLSKWLQDIELTLVQKESLESNSRRALYECSRARRRSRINKTEDIKSKAKKEFILYIKNPLFLAGLLLYWAEGDKNVHERVKVTNSDERMILLMMRWLREICKVPEEKFRVALHIHNLHSRDNIVDYWSNLVKLSKRQFYKPYVKETSLRQRKNILYNGTCAIVVHNKDLFRKIEGWKLGLQDYFNIRP